MEGIKMQTIHFMEILEFIDKTFKEQKMRKQTRRGDSSWSPVEHPDSTDEEFHHQPITTKVKNGVIEIPQPFLQHIPEETQCDIQMVSDNVMIIVFKERDGFDGFDTQATQPKPQATQLKDCFTQLRGIEHLFELHEGKLLDVEKKAAFLTQLQQEIQELWKLTVGKGKYFEQCVIMMKVALKRIAPESFNLTHLNLLLEMIRRLQQNQITKDDVHKYDKLLAAKGMDIMLELGEEVAQSYLESLRKMYRANS